MDYISPIIVFALIAAITPGPNNIMIMSSGLNFGIRRSMPHFFGISIGFLLMMTALGSGAGYVFNEFPRLHGIIKLTGVVYLLYLALKIATSSSDRPNNLLGSPLSFIEAALFQWVNPKAWVMGTTALATFTTSGADINFQIAVVVVVFFMMTWPSVGIWLFCGVAMQRLLSNPNHYRIFNVLMAVLLILSIFPVLRELYQFYLA